MIDFQGKQRGVAQLVAHYVRDVGVASSSLVTPTYGGRCNLPLAVTSVAFFVATGFQPTVNAPSVSPPLALSSLVTPTYGGRCNLSLAVTSVA